KAIDVLDDGLNRYPEHAAAYFLLGKAYTEKGNYSHALKYVKRGSELIHSPKTYDYYLREIEAIKKQRSFFRKPEWDEEVKHKHSDESLTKLEESLKSIPPLTESIKKLNEDLMEARETVQR